jgi:aspartyl aminopeptidase
LATDGLKLNAQKHMVPVTGLEGAPPLAELLVSELRAHQALTFEARDVFAYDLMTYDTQPSVCSGVRGEFIHAPRLDNLASCHAGISALTSTAARLPASTQVVVLYDHEEVGSQSAQGAAGSLLTSVLERAVSGFKAGEHQGFSRALARSFMVSADMAHAVHPNFADRHEPHHHPVIGGGPVIKTNAGQSYASDAQTAGLFAGLCDQLEIVPQHFVSRSDLRCGSTIGPISAARVGIRTVDVGSPMLSMHSCREMAGTADVEPMIDVLRLFLESDRGT